MIGTTGEMTPRQLRIGGFLRRSHVNGPGVRSVIWVQGCPIRCEGCFNRDFWDFDGGRTAGIDALFREIINTEGISGVTFSGGEPFFQASALAELGRMVHECDLTVVTFTGYAYGHLISAGEPSVRMLLEETDLLISGPYIRGLPRGHPLTGSSNQEIRALSGRISPEQGAVVSKGEIAEMTISAQGTLTLTGFPGSCLCDRLAGTPVTRGGG